MANLCAVGQSRQRFFWVNGTFLLWFDLAGVVVKNAYFPASILPIERFVRILLCGFGKIVVLLNGYCFRPQ